MRSHGALAEERLDDWPGDQKIGDEKVRDGQQECLAGILEDEGGLSGAKELDDRPALADALEMIKSKRADAIVVQVITRLARDVVLQETLIREISHSGGQL